MLNFEEELKKFKPSLEVEEVSEVPDIPEVTEIPEDEVKEVLIEAPKEPVNKPTCKCHKWVCWAIFAVILLGIAGTGLYFRETITQWWQCVQDCQQVTEEIVIEEVTEELVKVPLADQPREYVNFIGIERVGQDSRLAWIAYKYYAQKDLWVFIYEANRDLIKDPTYIRPGQHIRIPELSEEYRNLYNPELRQLVDSLATKYLTVDN